MEKCIQLRNGKTAILREGIAEDAEAAICFVNAVAGESDYLTFGEGEFQISVEEERRILEEFQQRENQLYLLAIVDGEIAGNITYRGGHRPRISHTGEFGISVLKKYWGLGIGKALIEQLLLWAKETGVIRKINLRVRADNRRAVDLYKSMGFREEGLLTRDFYMNGEFFDSIAMGMQID